MNLVNGPSDFIEELRNRIYEAVLCSQLHIETRSLVLLTPVKNLDNATSTTHVEDWAGLQRQAYGLTQACSQIRKEFLPRYRQLTRIRIDIRNLQDYLFGILSSNSHNSTSVCGNISIDITTPCRLDLRDVLLLHNRAPNLHLSFTHPEKESDMMSILLDTNRWPNFHTYVSNKASRVVLEIHFDDDYLVLCPDSADEEASDEERDQQPWAYPLTQGCILYVKEEFVEDWMREPRDFESWRAGLGEWEDALGLRERKRIRCPFMPRV